MEDYLRRAVGQDRMVTSDVAEARRFLERELGMPLEPLRLAELTLESVEICLLEGRGGALIVYKNDGVVLSHYLVPREGTRSRAPALADFRSGPPAGAMPVVTWATPEVEQALVGGVAPAELLAVAANGAT